MIDYLVDIEFDNIPHILSLVHFQIDLVFQLHLQKITVVIRFQDIHKN